MTRTFISAAILMLLSVLANAKDVLTTNFRGDNALRIIENKGQITDQYGNKRNDIDFSIKTANGLEIFIGPGGLYYQFSQATSPARKPERLYADSQHQLHQNSFSMYRMDVALRGSNVGAKVEAGDQMAYYEHYETAKCRKVTAHAFSKITYKDIYPNIDWVLYIVAGQLKHEFIVRAGAKVSDIAIVYAGAQKLMLNSDGGLSVVTPMGTITEEAPKCFDAHAKVNSHFVLKDSTLSYVTDSYEGTLTIDPMLQWGTYFNSITLFIAITTDNNNNVYGTGYTHMPSGVATTGAYQTTFGGAQDAFIVKYNAAGVLQWSTYYGGGSVDAGESLASDNAGHIYIAGATQSINGISTPGAYHESLAGVSTNDAYLSKFDTMGNLVWGTYFGGTNYDAGGCVKVAPGGDVYLTGSTSSAAGVATAGAFQVACGCAVSDSSDAFVAKFTSSGTLLWATYYGGDGNEGASSLAIDNTGNVYISGATSSTNNMATASAYQTTLLGGTSLHYDGFLAKFSPSGSRLWGTYFGGEDDDRAASVMVDTSGVYIAGSTASSSHIATAGAHQAVYGGGPYVGLYSDWGDAFLAKFDGSGTLQWSTYYGGANTDVLGSATSNGHGIIYLTGGTDSPTGIATPGAFASTAPGGFRDMYLAQFNSAGSLLMGTYYGGPDTDYGFGVATGDSGIVYVGGVTLSDTGIATAGADQPTFIPPTGAGVAYMVKFGICSLPLSDTITGPSHVCLGVEGALYSDGVAGGVWSMSNSNATIGTSGLMHPVSAGMDTVLYTITNACGSVVDMKAVFIDTPLSAGILSGTDSVCIGDTVHIASTSSGGTWTLSNPAGTITPAGIFTGVTAGRDTIVYAVNNVCGMYNAQKIVKVVNCNVGVGNDINNINRPHIYPSPTHDILYISALSDITNIKVYDLTGRLLLSEENRGKSTMVRLGQFVDGVYLLRINNTYNVKVVKE